MPFKITGTTLSTYTTNNSFQLKDAVKDFSLWLLVIANISTIYIAMKEGWSFETMMWIYWFQSMIIGFFNVIKILSLKDFTSKDFSINNKTFEPTIGTKFRAAALFIAYYGGFHLAYLIYLIKITPVGTIDFQAKYFAISIGIFFLNHLFSFFFNLLIDTKKRKLGEVTAAPFKRILPMHLIIMLGSIISTGTLLFLIIKTITDCKMHISEHDTARKEIDGEKLDPVAI